MPTFGYVRQLVAELRRRKVVGVAAAYAVVAWGVLQVAGTILQMLAAPAWIGPIVVVVVAAGFPIVVLLAWFFDLSSTGLVRTPGVGSGGVAPHTSTRAAQFMAIVIIAAVTLGAGFALWMRPPSTRELEFTQLTNFAEAATAPALSPDGRMLAFLKGRGPFGNSSAPSQVYIKQLPDGPEVQLTNSASGKATPAFSPDGARVYFTSTGWNTHVVSVNGGHESVLLPNASGLTILAGDTALFAEMREGLQMGIRRATLTREAQHDVYYPGEDGMAHRVAPSPDRKWVLVVEMDAGVWQPCRLVPLDGSSAGRQVGPPGAQCTYAAWSPDGRWMYFSSNAGGMFHLWRQRFPDGEPEQLTHGPTEEEGIAIAADGRSLITSAGVRHNAIGLLENDQERQISIEGYAFSPIASRDGQRVYFLSRDGASRLAYNIGRLIVTTLASGARDELLPGYPMVHFDISADDRHVVFVSGDDAAARRGIWVAPLDRSAAPRRVYDADTERVFFDPAGHIYFLQRSSSARYLHRLRGPDYAINERIYDERVRYIFAVSPDGEWIATVADGPGGRRPHQIAISTQRRPARVICAFCGGGAGPARVMAPALSWSRDGRALLVSGQFIADGFGMPGPSITIVIPVQPGAALPELPPTGITSIDDHRKLRGVRTIARQNMMPGATPEQLLYYETTTIRNLYRVQLR